MALCTFETFELDHECYSDFCFIIVGFWIKERTYFEHPDVMFTGDMILAVMDEDGLSQVYSTTMEINEMQSSWKAGVPFITMQKSQLNGSGKLESLRLNVELPGIQPEKVRNLQLLASFKYFLTEKLHVDMAGLMHVDLETPNGVAKARIDGDLKVDQAAPILIDSITRTLFNKNPLNAEDYANLGLPGILEHYFARSGK